jgi:2'-5' RNA ligase
MSHAADPSTGPWRLFIALPLPEPLRQAILPWQRAAQRLLPEGLRWTPPEQWHLTLRFLGDVDPEEVPLLTEALQTACAGQRILRLSFEGCGCFPSPDRPRVLWLGLAGELAALETFQSRVQQLTASWGQREDRPFRAHLTLARIREASPAARQGLARVLPRLPVPPALPWTADRVVLFRSELHPQGAIHTPLHECVLMPAPPAGP